MKIGLLTIAAWLLGAAATQAATYTCSFKPNARAYFMAPTVTIRDIGDGTAAMVDDAVIQSEQGAPVSAEREALTTRTRYSWALRGVDIVRINQDIFQPTSTIFYTLSIGRDNRATFSSSIVELDINDNHQLFGSCSVQP
jgi:hypothetical protein